jgi:hypothetical protein
MHQLAKRLQDNAPASKDNCTSVMLVSCLKPCYCWEHMAQKEIPTSNIARTCALYNDCFLSENLYCWGHVALKEILHEWDIQWLKLAALTFPKFKPSLAAPNPTSHFPFKPSSYFRICSFMLVKRFWLQSLPALIQSSNKGLGPHPQCIYNFIFHEKGLG